MIAARLLRSQLRREVLGGVLARSFVSRSPPNFAKKKKGKRVKENYDLDDASKLSRLTSALKDIQSQFGACAVASLFILIPPAHASSLRMCAGKGSVMKLGSREAVRGVEVISTGSLGLDIALGIGGLPKVDTMHAITEICA